MKLCIDRSHDNEKDTEEGFSNLLDRLKRIGYEIDYAANGLDEKLDGLDKGDILWIGFPKRHLDKKEMAKLASFLERGGGLLLTAEWGNLYENAKILNNVLLAMDVNIRFVGDRVTDAAHAIEKETKFMDKVIGSDKVPQFIEIRDFSRHPVTDDLNAIGYYAGCSIKAPDNNALAWSSHTSFSDSDANRKQDGDEEFGTFSVAAFHRAKKGRLMCIGDTSVLSNQYIEKLDNLLFSINIFKWLSRSL